VYFGIPRTHLQFSIVNVSGEFQNTSAIFVIIGQIISWRSDINYFLTLIKHYFFSQFYNYKKNKSLQIKAFSKLKSWSVSFITRYKLMNYTQKTSSYYSKYNIDWIYLFSLPLTFSSRRGIRNISNLACFLGLELSSIL
jgi:hypothetical protein